jgi:hypothetical protein
MFQLRKCARFLWKQCHRGHKHDLALRDNATTRLQTLQGGFLLSLYPRYFQDEARKQCHKSECDLNWKCPPFHRSSEELYVMFSPQVLVTTCYCAPCSCSSCCVYNLLCSQRCRMEQCFSIFVRPRPGKFFFYKTRDRSQQIIVLQVIFMTGHKQQYSLSRMLKDLDVWKFPIIHEYLHV